MIEIIAICATLSILFVTAGFTFCFWLVVKHLKHQEILSKSSSVEEYSIHEAVEKAPRPEQDQKAEPQDESYKDITDVSAEEAFKPR